MRTIIILLTASFFISTATAQTEEEQVKQIRKQFKWVNAQKDYKTIELNNMDFLDHATDNGASITAYYKNNKLYKIVEVVGISMGLLNSEYYFWDNELFFVYHTEKMFKEIKDAQGYFIEFDYSNTELKYEDRQYYNKGNTVRRIKKGEIVSSEIDYLKHCKKIKPIADNKIKYKAKYDMLQGKWTDEGDKLSTLEFDGLVQTTYYENEYIDNSRIKIEDNYFNTKSFEDNSENKYQIMELTPQVFKILYLASGSILIYKK